MLPSRQAARVVYGVLLVGALLAAESGLSESYLDTFASVSIAILLFWLAHGYAELLGRRLNQGERLTAASLARAMAHEGPLVRGASIPLVVLVLAALAGADQETAVTISLWSSVACLVALEMIAGLRAGARGRELVLEAGVGLTMGVAVLALKIILH